MAAHTCIASVRSSARIAAQHQRLTAAASTESDIKSADLQKDASNEIDESQQSYRISTLSISENVSESQKGMNFRYANSPNARAPITLQAPEPPEELESVLNRLEQKWLEITDNLYDVIIYLQKSSGEVTKASVDCLQSMHDNVEITCDMIDTQLKAQYHLMNKCDELTTKLSIASSFRDEIKTLLKSMETLEQLYNTSAQFEIRRQEHARKP